MTVILDLSQLHLIMNNQHLHDNRNDGSAAPRHHDYQLEKGGAGAGKGSSYHSHCTLSPHRTLIVFYACWSKFEQQV